ncbi:hypothetical protein KAR34_04665 [bacterium]|nr:hypothetical protein [bacterium]
MNLLGENYFYNVYAFPHLFAGLFILILGIYRLIKSRHLGLPFALLCFSFSIWYFGVAKNLFASDDPFQHAYSRVCYLGISFVPFFFYYYTLRVLNRMTRITKCILLTMAIISVFFSWLAQTDLHFITGSYHYYYGFYAKFGLWGWFYLGYFYLAMLVTLVLWYDVYKHEMDATLRRRIAIITAGLLLFIPATIDYLPSLGIAIYPCGYIAGLLFLIFQDYAIFNLQVTQFHILINNVLRRTVAILLLCLPWAIVSHFFFYLQRHNYWDMLFIFAVCAFLLLVPFINKGVPWLERLLFKKEYEFNKILQAFLNEIVVLKNIDKLALYIQNMLQHTMNTPNVRLVVKDQKKDSFHIWFMNNSTIDCPPALATFLPWLAKNPGLLIRYDVDYNPVYLPVRQKAVAAFDSLGAQILLPLVQSDSLLGVIVVGDKLNLDIFKPIEILFLAKFKSIVTIALNNSYLYEHICRLNRALWDGNVNLNEIVKEKTVELEKALAQMKKLNEEQAAFFTMASHNLRTPLTSIKAAATLLWRDSTATDKRDLCAVLQNNIRRLETLISYAIEVVKMENDKLEFMDGSLFSLPYMNSKTDEKNE